jgi:2-iminoacetate synthase
MYSKHVMQDSNYINGLMNNLIGSKRDADLSLSRAKAGNLTLDDAIFLLGAANDNFQELIESAHEIRIRYHGNKVGLIAPLYFSSYCINDCLGCNYRRTNEKIERKLLTLGEFKEELEAIRTLRYPTLELVSGSFKPQTMIYERFLSLIESAKESTADGYFKNLAFCIDALTAKEYADFADKNLTLVQFQESYDPPAYENMTGKTGTKADMEKRMNAYDEWISAGGKKFGLGILAGISDNFFKDVLMVIAHGKYMEKEYGISPSLIGIPRMQAAHSDKITTMQKRNGISDQALLKMVAVYRLAFPKASIVASTRETQEVIKQILYAGGTFTNHTCSTNVGGYPVLIRILNLDISDGKKKKMLEKILRGKDGQFYHPDPLFEEMKETIDSLGLRIDLDKEF